jgi:hypothetical protein
MFQASASGGRALLSRVRAPCICRCAASSSTSSASSALLPSSKRRLAVALATATGASAALTLFVAKTHASQSASAEARSDQSQWQSPVPNSSPSNSNNSQSQPPPLPSTATFSASNAAITSADKVDDDGSGVSLIVNPPVAGRKRLVVLGTGWAAVSFLRGLVPDADTDVTVVSPRGYFLYSPLLPAAAVGSVETRSICEPIRTLLPPGAVFVEAAATAIDPTRRTIECEPQLDPSRAFTLQYVPELAHVDSMPVRIR